MKCPVVTHDIKLNLKNRDWAFKNVGYGPANPESPDNFWNERAAEWNTTPKNAQTMRCGNCSAFIQTPEMMECIVLRQVRVGAQSHQRFADVVSAFADA